MKITAAEGVKPRRDDEELTRRLHRCETSIAPGDTMRIGIRNEAGYVCKGIETDGAPEFMRVIECLDSLGFRDELRNSQATYEGFDAIFSKM